MLTRTKRVAKNANEAVLNKTGFPISLNPRTSATSLET